MTPIDATKQISRVTGEFCAHYGLTRPQLAERMEQRQQGVNAEFDAWVAANGETEESLRQFYASCEWMPYSFLGTAWRALREWTGWLEEQLDASCLHLVLDVGCGFGAAAGALPARFSVTLADVAGPHLEFTRKLWPAASVMTLDELAAHSGTAGAVLSLAVLEHVPDPAAHLDRLLGRVAPGGVLVLAYHFGHYDGVHTHLRRHQASGMAERFPQIIASRGLRKVASKGADLEIWERT